MDLIFITILLFWLLTELMLFFIQYENTKSPDPIRSNIQYELDMESNLSVNLYSSSDSGINDKSTEESESGLSSTTQSVSSYLFRKFFVETRAEQTVEMEKRKKRIQAKRLARRENDRKKLEEYFKSKRLDEDGYETDSEESLTDLMNALLNLVIYIREYKVISVKNMANHFQLEPNELLNHIGDLQSIGIINGVLDDRGKFIYVPETESKAVVRFIQQQHLFHWPKNALI